MDDEAIMKAMLDMMSQKCSLEWGEAKNRKKIYAPRNISLEELKKDIDKWNAGGNYANGEKGGI